MSDDIYADLRAWHVGRGFDFEESRWLRFTCSDHHPQRVLAFAVLRNSPSKGFLEVLVEDSAAFDFLPKSVDIQILVGDRPVHEKEWTREMGNQIGTNDQTRVRYVVRCSRADGGCGQSVPATHVKIAQVVAMALENSVSSMDLNGLRSSLSRI